MTQDEDNIIYGIFFVGLLLGILLTCFISSGVWTGLNLELKREAVAKNCAEWVVDEYGKTTFKFKDHTDKKNLAEKD